MKVTILCPETKNYIEVRSGILTDELLITVHPLINLLDASAPQEHPVTVRISRRDLAKALTVFA